jgi:hypothetical protein
MFWRKKKEHGLYYLLPGMSSGNRRKHKKVLLISVLIGIAFSGLFGFLLWFLNSRRF